MIPKIIHFSVSDFFLVVSCIEEKYYVKNSAATDTTFDNCQLVLNGDSHLTMMPTDGATYNFLLNSVHQNENKHKHELKLHKCLLNSIWNQFKNNRK